jgi:MATE family multidrug resistance protein
MRAAVVANVANIGLDWLFIYGLEWGVAGAAWATVIGQALEAAILFAAQRTEGVTLRTSWALARRVLRVGAPIGVQFTLEMGAFATLAAMLAALSDVEMAAHQIALQVVHFAFLPILSVSEAVAVLSGQAMGARRHELVLSVARKGLVLASAYAAIWTVVLLGWPALLAGAFTDDAHLAATTVRLFYVMAAFQLLDGANAVARGALQGVRDVRYAATVGIATAWAMTPPLTWLLGYRLGWGALGGWIGLSLEILLASVILWRRLLSERWRHAARLARLRERRRARERSRAPRLAAQPA